METKLPIRVRYQETDQMGVVYHTNYINWFEWGRTEWIRELGLSYKELESVGILLPVIDLETKYIRPAFYDDELLIHTKLLQYSSVKVQFAYEIRRKSTETSGEEVLVTGSSRHVFVDHNWKPVRLHKIIPSWDQALKEACDR